MREISELRLAFIGNFRPQYSTENELRDALRRLGVAPMAFQESEGEDWESLTKLLRAGDFDLVLWTSTEPFAAKVGAQRQFYMLDAARRAGVPVIGYHLDRFVGLKNREETIPDRPYFSVDMLYSADGGHDAEWAALGVRHTWMPPAISERWCQPGNVVDQYKCDLVFVGTWKGYTQHHVDWEHRDELVMWAAKQYGDRFKVLPPRGQPRIGGLELNDVYWSAKVVLGDSCLVPNPDGSAATHYCSDRVPETLGRGGILLHPSVMGVDEVFERHLVWNLYDWSELKSLINDTIAAHSKNVWCVGASTSASMLDARLANIAFIKANHTYTHRMRAVLADWGWGE